MEGVSIIETQTILTWEKRFINMENLLMELLKLNKQIVPGNLQHSIPDFITIENAAKNYHTSKTTIYTKIKLFEKLTGRKIDRMQIGTFNLVNEVELLEAMRIKTPVPELFKIKKG